MTNGTDEHIKSKPCSAVNLPGRLPGDFDNRYAWVQILAPECQEPVQMKLKIQMKHLESIQMKLKIQMEPIESIQMEPIESIQMEPIESI